MNHHEALKNEILLRPGSSSWAMLKNSVLMIFHCDERYQDGKAVPSGYDEGLRKEVLTGFDIKFRKAMNELLKEGLLTRARSTRLKFRNSRILHTGRAVDFSYQKSAQ